MSSSAMPWAFATSTVDKFSSFYRALSAPHTPTPQPAPAPLPIPNGFGNSNGAMTHTFVQNPPSAPITKASDMYMTSIYAARIASHNVKFLVKTCVVRDKEWTGFFSEMYLYKTQLRPLQGIIVPNVISVMTGLDGVNVIMEPPHSSFWMQASPDMPLALKKRCVRAYQLLHARGMCQASVSLENILIGADGRVTINHFHRARGAEKIEEIGLRAASRQDIRIEMRRLKYLLNFEDAREEEEEKHARCQRRHVANQDEFSKAQMDFRYAPNIDRGSREDRQNPPFETEQLQRMKATLRAYTPKRFVMPGQSAEELAKHVREFLSIVDNMDGDDDSYLNAPQPPLPFALPTPPLFPGASQLKRKNGPAASPPPATKRLRPDMPPPPLPGISNGATAGPGPSSRAASSSRSAVPPSRASRSSSRASGSTSRASSSRPCKKASSSPDVLTSLTAANVAQLPGSERIYVNPDDLVSTLPVVDGHTLLHRDDSPPPRRIGYGSASPGWRAGTPLTRSASAPEVRDLDKEEEREVERMLASESGEGPLLRIRRSLWDLLGRVL
ncbi:hypothetical protein BD626DRAFT_504102 [Schizophyllum amplum]|uniref:Uncharacterized protein n=1 Tax=Schizophyllum amplum TaxID=97359 RepID=A0A550C6Q5_9AGAR|nr:hypothetical protein BD626DRAFT_504102 [Auriculariopsis ampla]